MSKTLIIPDVHLGKGVSIGKPGIGTALNSRVVDQFNLLDWILETAIERHVSCIIFTGDIFEDVKPDYVLVDNLVRWLIRCDQQCIDIHIIAGNHDIKRSGAHYTSPLDIIQSLDLTYISVYKQLDTIYNGTVGFTLLPFRDRRSFQSNSSTECLDRIKSMLTYEIQDIPSTYDKVLVGHMAIEGSLIVGDEFDDEANELMCPPSMFEGYQYVWMGHVHKPQVLQKKKPYVAHVGSLDISDFGETDHQKIIILFDSLSKNKFEEIPVPTRPLRRLRLGVTSYQNTTEILLEAIDKLHQEQNLTNAIVKLEIQLAGADVPNADRSRIVNKITSLGAFHLASFTETRSTSVVPQDKANQIENTIDVRSAVKMWAEQLKFENETEKSDFIENCFSIVEELEAK